MRGHYRADRHLRLRALLVSYGYNNLDVARWIDRSESYVTTRMRTGDWALNDCYQILARLGIDKGQLVHFFPQDGKDPKKEETEEEKALRAMVEQVVGDKLVHIFNSPHTKHLMEIGGI